ncbi:hypothetical protein GCM10022228_15740 [Halomonas cibimaris]|uniref:Uncharacterized protein n=1 Tax=Halomonas cibimaris TaxID=657012 RepID=A0ABP7LQ20_9GAMM
MVVAQSTAAPIDAERILRVLPGTDAGVTYSRGWRRIKFSRLGHSSGYNGKFIVCRAGRRAHSGTRLVLSQLGRIRMEKMTCAASPATAGV